MSQTSVFDGTLYLYVHAERVSGDSGYDRAYNRGVTRRRMLAAAPTYLMTMGAGRWAGEEAAEVTPIVSPDTRVTWAVTTENLENIIINMSGVTQSQPGILVSLKAFDMQRF